MPTPWMQTFDFTWDPIITFTRRRLELMDWLEANADPASFLESDEQLGVAIGSPAQRVRLDRKHLHIELLAPDAAMGDLEPVLDQALRLMAPEAMHLVAYRSMWSVPLVGDYDSRRRGLALNAAGRGADAVGHVFDCALFVEQTVDGDRRVGSEFGVVTFGELVQRITGVTRGRNRGDVPYSFGAPPEPFDAGEALLYVDQSWDLVGADLRVAELGELLVHVTDLAERAGSLVVAFAESLE